MNNLSISLLGSFQATLNEEPLTQFRTKSVQAILIYLVCAAKRPSSREQLMDLLWPGMPLKSAQANLRQTVYRLRQTIPEVTGKNGEPVSFLVTNRQTIQINPEADYLADVHEFAALIATAPEKAIKLYRGDFLADFFLPDSETFEAWANGRREVYRQQVLAAMERVTAVSIENANYDKAIQLARQQLSIDNLRENSHRQLMEAWAKNGRRQEAFTQYDYLCQLLQTELDIEPETETLTLIEAIRTGTLRKKTAPTIPQFVSANTRPKDNLPQRLTSFIGREKEIKAIIDLVSKNRLVMLTGVGGIGKTNLSLQVGQHLITTFPDGVWLVELAPVADLRLVPDTIAAALGLHESTDRPIQDLLLDYLREKHCLLILDNCEHLIHAVAQCVQMVLQRCPEVKILASSREALAVPGERPFHVPSLTAPSIGQPSILEAWQEFDALRLFVERTQLVLPDFQVTSDNVDALVRICRHLDGIPLALELAAARMKVLTTAQIATRLDDRFRLLTSGSRTALPRHQTLRALIDWSWDLLTQSEQLLLQRLSVFAGGMQLESIEAICAEDGLESYELLNVLNELVNKSLVIAQRQQGQDSRYHLLETIRQYAHDRLAAVGQVNTFRQRHLDYFQLLTEKARPQMLKSKQASWLNRIQREMDNIRTALLWAQEADVETGLKLIWSLTYFWWQRGYYLEMDARLTQLLSKSDGVSPLVRSRALWTHAFLDWGLTGDRAISSLEESLAIYLRLEDDPAELARILMVLGYCAALSRDFAEGQAYCQQSVEIMRSLPDQGENKTILAETLLLLGEIEMGRFPDRAKAYLHESELLFRDLEDFGRLSWNLGKSGALAVQEGDYEAAQAMFEEALVLQEMMKLRETGWTLTYLGTLYTKLENYPLAEACYQRIVSNYGQTEFDNMVVIALDQLGNVYLRQGKLDQAEQSFIKNLQYHLRTNLWGIAYSLERAASVAVKRRVPERGVKLYAWADTIRQGKRPFAEQEDVDQDMLAIREMIDEEAFHMAYAEGRAMTTEEAIAYALTVE